MGLAMNNDTDRPNDPDPDDLDSLAASLEYLRLWCESDKAGDSSAGQLLQPVRNEHAPVAERPVALSPEFEERVMVTIHEFNAAASVHLADYASRALFSCRDTGRRLAATEEVVAHSRALMVEVDALIAKLIPKGGLWPAY
jgi:hypothetical protein